MTRVIVTRKGRRISGWAYKVGGDRLTYVVELRHNNAVIATQSAHLTFLTYNPFLSPDEAAGHGFEFMLSSEQMRLNPSQFSLTVADQDQVWAVPDIDPGFGLSPQMHVDYVDNDHFAGWCWDPAFPDRSPELELFSLLPGDDGRKAPATIQTQRFRADLAAAGMAGGNVGFWVPWPIGMSPHLRRHAVLQYESTRVDLGQRVRAKMDRTHLELPGYMLYL